MSSTDRTPLTRQRGRARAVARRGTGRRFHDPGVSECLRHSRRFRVRDVPGRTSLGFVQFALRDAAVQAPEDGVLVAASVQAKRIAGDEPPQIAVLRPTEDDGARVTVVGSAPLPVSSAGSSVHRVEGLHLPVRKGDSVGFLFRAGEVDLGIRRRPRPDGAIQSFALPCDPCGMDGGTGSELLFDALVEPDVDGGWARRRIAGSRRRRLRPGLGGRLVRRLRRRRRARRGPRRGRARRQPGPIRLLAANRLGRRRVRRCSSECRGWDAWAPPSRCRPTAARARGRSDDPDGRHARRRAGRVRLRLAATPRGARALERRRRLRTKVVVAYSPVGRG